MTDDRAVSDTIGFVLAFALVTATIAVTFATGVPALESQQHAEQVNNVERAFDVLADNVRDIQRHDDPSRATEIRMPGGTLAVEGSVVITVEIYDPGTGNATTVERVRTHPLVYSSEGSEIGYEAGMLFRGDRGAYVMLNRPRFVGPVDDRMVLSFIETRRGDRERISGETTVLVVTEQRASTGTTTMPVEDGEQVNVTIESPRVDAWNRTMADTEFEFVERDGDTVVYKHERLDEVTVSKARVKIDLTR